ncbi:DHA1 family tetracycline resistance protein-like MFS transporter [Aquabacterium commune]|uniref:DHA1 family tetracycline resistance protein-like MFS transporter n=1 Tax=Aquabacterium commune TaxID=70586 RepID=A0A4R6REF9_9BURK|nr:MFS transporter [Aquabacterium commune]TDP84572.1 DHA1 family tetracycline resistance protein-like MFS transporter [Aquabacterium commune]
MASTRGRQAAMPFIMITVLLDMMSIGIIAPVLPKLIGTFMDSGAGTSVAYGLAQAAFAIAQFFSAPLLGGLSDKHGRRPVLLLGLLGMAVNFFVTALATEFWMLLAVRVMGGAVCANIAVANAYVADITEPHDRAKNYGLLGAMFGVGFILGPVMGGILGDHNVHWPFLLAGTLTLLNCVYGYFVLPESLPLERRREFTLARANPFTALAQLRQLKGVEMLLWVMGLSILAQFCLHTSWFLYTEFKFGWTPKDNGLSLFAVGMMAVLVQGGLLRQFQKIMPTDKLVRIGLVSSTIAFAAWGLVPEGWMMYVIIAANVFGYMVQPGLQSLVANAVDPTRQGESMGAVSSINSVAAVLGPLMGSPLLATVSHFPQGDWRIGAPFYLCAAIQAVAAWLGLRYLGRAGNLRASAPAA